METIVEIKYKNYTENVIMTNSTAKELTNIAKTDKDYVSHKVIQQGMFAFAPVVEKIKHVGKINYGWGEKAGSVYAYRISYAGKAITIKSDMPISLIRKEAKRIANGYKGYNCDNYLKQGIDY